MALVFSVVGGGKRSEREPEATSKRETLKTIKNIKACIRVFFFLILYNQYPSLPPIILHLLFSDNETFSEEIIATERF